MSDIRLKHERNNSLYDNWSLLHLLSGIGFAWVMPPYVALALLILWEPLEIFILSPILAKFDILFGYETLRNSLSDIVFDGLGILIGSYVLAKLVDAPFHLF